MALLNYSTPFAGAAGGVATAPPLLLAPPYFPAHHQPINYHHYQQQQQQPGGVANNHNNHNNHNHLNNHNGYLPFNPYQQQQLPQQQQQPASFFRSQPSSSPRQQPQPQPQAQQPPERSPGYTRIDTSRPSSTTNQKTQIHAILDYDEDEDDGDYYDDDEGAEAEEEAAKQRHGKGQPHVTPIQGPIYLRNGSSVPVVPLYSYPQLNNGSFVQIPILWTALSVALGIELRGEIIRGVPCIKRYHQLFCPTAGKSYPLERIELFIDENKALMKRMYGDFEMGPPEGRSTPSAGKSGKAKRAAGAPDLQGGAPGRSPTPLQSQRNARQSFLNQTSESGRVDACESKVEIVTPYWASNSAGKVRAIVNTQHFEQAIHQEVCSKVLTNRCSGDCGCEQKYKWHRLLAYDPDDDCKGIFMDWFLFPSCCVCRCNPT